MYTIKCENSGLEVHVAGNGIGESIALRLPDGSWGVVDVYLPSLANPDSSPTVRLLRERGVKTLKFLCLTHADSDHYRGMSHLLKEFAVDQFWMFGAIAPKELYQRIAAILKIKAERLKNLVIDLEDADDFAETIRLVRQLRSDGKLERKAMVLGLPLCRIPASGSNSELRITALGPHSDLVDKYEQHIERCFDLARAARFLKPQEPKLNNNLASAALLIEYGKSTVVLGGDMESEGWDHALKYSASPLTLDAQLVKVSHHGSTTGYSEGLWEKHLSPRRSATAVVTAFTKRRLPPPEGLQHLKACATRLFTTSKSAIRPSPADVNNRKTRRSAFRGMSPDVVTALEATFASACLRDHRPQGICSFLFNDQGEFEHRLTGDAVEL